MQAPVAYVEVDFIAGRYRPEELVMAGPGRRLAGAIIDSLIQAPGLVLIVVGYVLAILTFGISLVLLPIGMVLLLPWFIWFVVVAPNGQTPGKQIVGEYIMKADGSRAGGWYVWLREFVIKGLLCGFLNVLTFGLFWLLAALWCLWDKNKQCLWDKFASTYVAHSPFGFKPLTMNEIVAQGLPRPAPAGHHAAAQLPQIIINNNAQIGSNDNRRLDLRFSQPDRGAARIGVMDRGRTLPDIPVVSGQAIVVGRDSHASVVLSDPKASRRHAEIALDGSVWVVRDLGAMNPARLLSGNGAEVLVGSSPRRLEHGQLAIGDSIITLYPVGR